MIVVIQCAATKTPNAGCLQRRDGKNVVFVANPECAPTGTACVYARPDDVTDTGSSWRDELRKYNASSHDNPLRLLPAWQLYQNKTYKLLAECYGLDSLYILSAGWGLIRSEFLTSKYDITFSNSACKYKRRGKKDRYKDLGMIPKETVEPIVFFIGKAYISLACDLTKGIEAEKYLFYNSKDAPHAPSFIQKRYLTRIRTNWHYYCAKDFMAGAIEID